MTKQNLNEFFLPEKIVFQNEMTLDLAGFMVLINKFKDTYQLMQASFSWDSPIDTKSSLFKDLKKSIVRKHEDKEFFIELGVNTKRIIFYHGVDTLLLEEETDGMTEEYLKDIPVSPLVDIRIPIAPLLKLAKEIGDPETCLDFTGVNLIRIRDYDTNKELILPIEDVINGSSE